MNYFLYQYWQSNLYFQLAWYIAIWFILNMEYFFKLNIENTWIVLTKGMLWDDGIIYRGLQVGRRFTTTLYDFLFMVQQSASVDSLINHVVQTFSHHIGRPVRARGTLNLRPWRIHENSIKKFTQSTWNTNLFRAYLSARFLLQTMPHISLDTW